MKVDLLHCTPLEIAIDAIRMCYRSEGRSDTTYHILGKLEGSPHWEADYGERDKELIRRIIKSGHTSTVESISYVYQIKEISRITLLQMERHRHVSYSVESQRYVTQSNAQFIMPPKVKKLIENTNDDGRLKALISSVYDDAFYAYEELIQSGVPKEDARYFLPQGITTNLVMTINARSLRNFLQLRLDKKAQWEIRELATLMLNKLPAEHRETVFYDIKLDKEEVKDV